MDKNDGTLNLIFCCTAFTANKRFQSVNWYFGPLFMSKLLQLSQGAFSRLHVSTLSIDVRQDTDEGTQKATSEQSNVLFLAILGCFYLYILGHYPVRGPMSSSFVSSVQGNRFSQKHCGLSIYILAKSSLAFLCFFFFFLTVESSWVFFHGAHCCSKSVGCCDRTLMYLDLGVLLVSLWKFSLAFCLPFASFSSFWG